MVQTSSSFFIEKNLKSFCSLLSMKNRMSYLKSSDLKTLCILSYSPVLDLHNTYKDSVSTKPTETSSKSTDVWNVRLGNPGISLFTAFSSNRVFTFLYGRISTISYSSFEEFEFSVFSYLQDKLPIVTVFSSFPNISNVAFVYA